MVGVVGLSLTGTPKVAVSGTHAADFTVTALPTSPVAVSGSTTFQVTFDPSAGGTRTATLTIANDDSDEGTFDFAIQGTGLVPEINVTGNGVSITDGDANPSATDHTDFGTATGAGATVVRTFTVQNLGGEDLVLTGTPKVAVSGTHAADFTVTAVPASPVAASGSTTFQVTFTPSGNGTRTATLTIANNDSDEGTYDFAIRGTGQLPEIRVEGNNQSIADGDVTPATLDHTDFGNAALVGGTVTRTFTIKNTGDGSLNLSGTPKVAVSGSHAADFTVTVQPTTPVASVSGSTTFQVSFDPSARGTRTATLTIANDDFDESSFDFAIRGFGIDAGSLDTSFEPSANSFIWTSAIQADGKILVGGEFTTLGGVTRNRIARFNVDGSLDTSFDANVGNRVRAILVQPDGKILIGGSFAAVGGVARSGLARVNADGSLDTGFNPAPNNPVYTMAMQPDGKILIGGEFDMVGAVNVTRIARLNSDGSLDSSFFSPSPNTFVYSIAVQADGKILVGGEFNNIGGFSSSSRQYLARLSSDGSLETAFQTSPNNGGYVYSIALQSDGKILVGGDFTSIGGQSRTALARLNSNGTADTSFNADLNGGQLHSIALQADGRILVGGSFTTVGGIGRNNLARLEADGSLDSGFDAMADGLNGGLSLQTDGKLLSAGSFLTIGGSGRNWAGRVNVGVASQSLSVASASRVEWLRGGVSPEVAFVSFELSTDGGNNWSSLGSGTRISGGWELTGLSLPSSGRVRAQGRANGGYNNGSSSLLEITAVFSGEINVTGNGVSIADGDSTPSTADHTDFGSTPTTGGTVVRTFTIQNLGVVGLSLTGTPKVAVSGAHAADYTVTALPTSPLAVSGSTTFQVTFDPSAGGTRTATLTIANDDSDEGTFDFAIQGTGLAPEINVTGNGSTIVDGDSTPASADHTDFGSSLVTGGTVVRTFTIQNLGVADLILSGTPKVAVSGTYAADFTVTAVPTSPVAASGSTTFQVTFDPSALGLRTATLTIANDDSDEGTFDFAIQGTGVNNAPTDISLSSARVQDAAAVNTTIGTFTATDADAGDTAAFTLVAGTGSTDNGKFSITGGNTLKVAVSPVLADSTYAIRVRVTDGAGATFEKQFTILVMAVVVDAGDYLIADRGPYRSTGVILVVTKTGAVQRIISTQLKDPYDIVVDAAGDLIVADYDYDPGFSGGRGSGLYKIHRQTGVHTRLVFGAPLVTPLGVKVEADGKLLVADADYGYSSAHALTVSAGAVIRANANGSSPTVLASGGNFFFLQGLALAPNGDIYVANFANGNANFPTRIIKVDKTTGAQTAITTGGLTRPMGLAVESDGNSLVVVDVTAKKLIRVALPAGTQTDVSADSQFIQPTHVTIEADGNYLVTDGKSSGTAGERRIYRVNKTTGVATILVSDGFFQQPRGVTLAQ